MKTRIIVIMMLYFAFAKAQTAFKNYGLFQIHSQGQIGFHTDVINDGFAINNEGFAGFYSTTNQLTYSGDNIIRFQDLEIDVLDDLLISNSIQVKGDMYFTNGDVITPRIDPNISLQYLDDNVYFTANNDNHIDGYSEFNGEFGFEFPIGDSSEMKPLGVDNFNGVKNYQTAFFFEDPNSPTTFPNSFDTTNFENTLDIVSTVEYWFFKGEGTVDLTLNWTNSSNINTIADNVNDLRISGWDDNTNKWVNLGNLSTTGDVSQGSITTTIDNPEEYNIYTIASVLEPGEDILAYNLVTPNGDGMNDTFVIRGIDAFPNNELIIYNRWGVAVFKKENYDNSFGGISSGRITISEDEKLPTGTYFYVLKLENRKDLAGYLYIQR